MSVKHARRQRELEVVGYTLPLKHMLGVEGIGENAEAMDRYLGGKSREVIRAVFGDEPVDIYSFRRKVGEGVLNQEYNKERLHGEYLKALAYHIYVKAEVLRLACDCGVVLTVNPLADVLNEPMECAVVRKADGLRRVEEFLSRTDDFLQGECGVPLTYPRDIRERRIREHAYLPITSARELLIYPADFRKNLELQRPPETSGPLTEGDVKSMRAWFNDWYRRNPYKAAALVDELSSGVLRKTERQILKVQTPFGEAGGIPATFVISDYPKHVRDMIMGDRI